MTTEVFPSEMAEKSIPWWVWLLAALGGGLLLLLLISYCLYKVMTLIYILLWTLLNPAPLNRASHSSQSRIFMKSKTQDITAKRRLIQTLLAEIQYIKYRHMQTSHDFTYSSQLLVAVLSGIHSCSLCLFSCLVRFLQAKATFEQRRKSTVERISLIIKQKQEIIQSINQSIIHSFIQSQKKMVLK